MQMIKNSYSTRPSEFALNWIWCMMKQLGAVLHIIIEWDRECVASNTNDTPPKSLHTETITSTATQHYLANTSNLYQVIIVYDTTICTKTSLFGVMLPLDIVFEECHATRRAYHVFCVSKDLVKTHRNNRYSYVFTRLQIKRLHRILKSTDSKHTLSPFLLWHLLHTK